MSTLPFFFVVSTLLILVSILVVFEEGVHLVQSKSAACIFYDPIVKVITIKCKTASLRDIANEVNDPKILKIENPDRVWQLNAGIRVEKGSTLYMNSSDLYWLKILSKSGNGYERKKEASTNVIEAHGTLKIDSIKLTSWDIFTNDYARNPGSRDLSDGRIQMGAPRPYISVESDATGTTDITNSEIAYLGYEGGVGAGPDDGLTYFGGDGSIIKNNNIHDLYLVSTQME